MTKLVSLDAKREEKAPVCDYCGEKDHEAVFGCPRIAAVTYDQEEGTVTVTFYTEWTPRLAG